MRLLKYKVKGRGDYPLADCKGRAFTTLCQEPPLGGIKYPNKKSASFSSPAAMPRDRLTAKGAPCRLLLGVRECGALPLHPTRN